MKVVIDIETRSEVDLKSAGRYNYMHHPSFEIIIMAVKMGQHPTVTFTKPTVETMQNIIDNAISLDADIVAHNATFEIEAFEAVGVNTYTNEKSSNWRDTMVQCQYHGVPMSLENAGKFLQIKNTKLTTGKELIDLFTKPISDKVKIKLKLPEDKIFWEPEDKQEQWEAFCAYGAMDVDSCSEINDILPSLPNHVWDEWLINVRINRRGVLIDTDLCEVAVQDLKTEADECMTRLKQITNLDNPGSRVQLKAYIKQTFDIELEKLDKEVISELLKSPNTPLDLKTVLNLFSIISKTSTAKYQKFLDLKSNENKVYDLLNFYGARTGRWSSWGVQIHNLKRISLNNYNSLRVQAKLHLLPYFYDGLSDIYSQLIRTCIVAPRDKMLVIADFSQIEARVLQWLAEDEEMLGVFRSGKDYYTYTAAQMYNKKYEDIPKDSEERRKGKVAALALGFGGAVGALNRSPSAKDMTETEKSTLVKLWRKANSNVVKLWSKLDAAFVKCMATKAAVSLTVAKKYSLVFEYTILAGKPSVSITLPSLRKLWFPDVKSSGTGYSFYGKKSEEDFNSTYVGIYGGFLSENVTQAIARDCLQTFINRLIENDLPVSFHVHDEVICEVPEEDNMDTVLNKILEISKQQIYEGLPVIAEPKASEYYDK